MFETEDIKIKISDGVISDSDNSALINAVILYTNDTYGLSREDIIEAISFYYSKIY